MTTQRPPMTAHFVPGQSVGMVTSGAVALLATDRRSQLVGDLWSALVERAPFDDVIELLLATGLRNLPPLALISVEGATTRALVRGDMVARLGREGHADVVIDGSTVSTWLERTEADVETVEMYPTHDLSEPAGFFVSEGVVPATRFRCAIGVNRAANPFSSGGSGNAGTPEVPPAPGQAEASPSAQAEPADSPSAGAGAIEDPPPAATPGSAPPQLSDVVAASAVPESPDEPTPATPDALEGVDDLMPAAPTEEALEDVHESTPATPDGTTDGARSSSTIQFRADLDRWGAPSDVDGSNADGSNADGALAGGVEPGNASVAPAQDDDGDDEDDEYDHLFGATQFRPIADAGMRPDDDDDSSPGPGGVISAVPPSTPLSAPPAAQPPAPPDVDQPGDHDGMTISLSQLRNARAGAGAAAAVGEAAAPGSTVHAVSCPTGHLNPPTASSCRVCGIEIPDQAHVSVPRPPLGTLHFSDGTTRVLSRPMLLGRSPTASGPVSGELPELVSLHSPSKELSGTHLEMRIEGWQVLVVDRHSTNGTTVQLPGRDPIRMHPGEPVPVVPGTVVDMAEEVQFTFEAGE